MSCSSPIKDKYFHGEFSQPIVSNPEISYLVRTPILQICRTFVSLWNLLYSWWNANCLSNSSPWIQLIPVLKTWTFTISQNVLHCLLLHPLRIVFVLFTPDHSPCARMIWIPTTNLILLRRLQWWIAVALLLFEGRQLVSPFYHPSIHQISTLEKTKLCHRPTLSQYPFWVAWWVCFFNESVALVTGVTADNRFPHSIVHLSLRTQKTLTFLSGFPRAFWWSKPTLAKPTILISVVCKDFGFWELIVCFFWNWLFRVFLCVELWGGGLSREVGAPMVWASRVEKGVCPKGGEPKISLFFPSPATIFILFSLSLGGLLVEFWWCLERRGPPMCALQHPKSPNVHILGSRPSNTTKIPR